MKDLRQATINALMEMGVNPSIKGFKSTLSAIQLIDADDTWLQNITGLYTQIAQENSHDTGSKVERSIRHMTESMIAKYDLSVVKKYINLNGDKLTNGKFLASLYYTLKQSLEGTTIAAVDSSKITNEVLKQFSEQGSIQANRVKTNSNDICPFCGKEGSFVEVNGIHVCYECAKSITSQVLTIQGLLK